MYYDGGKGYYSDGTRVPEYSSEHGSAITGGASGGGFVAIIAVFLGAVVAGGFALLWFAIAGYKTFNLGNSSRIIALGLSIAYGYIVFITFASGHPDLMILVYANIPIAIFFIGAYLQKSQTTRLNDKERQIVKIREEKLRSVNSKSEKIICSADGIILTEKEFIIEDKTYLVSDIISAKMKRPTSLVLNHVITLIVSVFSLPTIYEKASHGHTDMYIAYGVTLAIILYQIFLFMSKQRVLILDLRSSGVKKVLQDDNKEAISGFTDAINKLVSKRNN